MECKNCPDAEKCGRKLELAIAGVTGWKCLHEFSLENVIEHLNTLMDRRVLSDEWTDMIGRAVELLKEQQQIINSLKSDLQETLKVVSEQSNIVRCKDCNKRGTSECYVENASGELAFPWIPPDDWFCADGERTDT